MSNPSDEKIKTLLTEARVIAVVGHSDKPYRTSYQIAEYLRQAGYKVYPVNPVVQEINGQKSYASLGDLPEHIDIVNVFRRAEHLDDVVQDAIGVGVGAVWGQLGVTDAQAATRAQAAELEIVMDLCIKIEHRRLIR